MLSKEKIRQIIEDKIIVDCYDEQEAEMGWAIYMTENLHYPFTAEYEMKKASGGRQKVKVQVVGNESGESNFSMDVFYVQIELNGAIVPADVESLEIVEADEMTLKTLEVWKHRDSY